MNIRNLFKKNTNVDFLAIGDIVVDAFIKLTSAEIVDNASHTGKNICMPFGEKIPFESVTELFGVGNSANAAVSASRIGLNSALLSHTGNDYYGNKNKAVLEMDRVNTDLLSIDDKKKTNYHYVLWFDHERTILINHEKYDYTLPNQLTSKQMKPRYIYLSSLGGHTLDFHIALGQYLMQNPEVKLVFQPGTYQIKFGTETLKDLYARTELFFCNKEEAAQILNLAAGTSITDLLAGLVRLGVKLPVITDGPDGSYAYNEDGKVIHLPIFPDIAPPLERTGAGDAFASTFSSAKALGLDTATAMMWGSINSMSVCQFVGAQKGLLKREEIERYFNTRPQDWVARIIG